MTELFIKLLNMSITASYLILAVLLIRVLAKRIPRKYICLLWGLAGVRLVIPMELESVLSLIPSGRTITKDIMMEYIPRIDSGMDTVDNAVNAALASSSASPYASANPMQIYMWLFSIIWLVGIGILALICFISYIRLDYRLISAERLQDRVYQCHEIETPFVLGLFRPRIYLPTSIDMEFDHVIAHEEAHIKRFDHLTKPLAYLILMVHWFNPLVWIAFIMYTRDVELACDEKVVKDMTVDERKAYSNALLHCSVKHSALSICPLAFGEVGVKDRIYNVLHFKKPGKAILAGSIAVIGIIAICFMTSPKSLATSGIAVERDMDSAISQCLLAEKYDDGGQTECSAEGHVVLGTEEGDFIKVYAMVSTGRYGFFDDKFLQKIGSGTMPAVIYLTKDKEGYQYQKIDYPQDGDAYEKFVQAMFPQKLQKNALNGQKYDSRLTQQKEAYAKVYLKSLRRKAEVGEYGDFAFQSLTDYDFPIEVIDFLGEKYRDYDTWLGPSERLFGSVRHVYQMSTDGKNTVTYHHYLKDSSQTVEKTVVTISVEDEKAKINCRQQGAKASEYYEIKLNQ